LLAAGLLVLLWAGSHIVRRMVPDVGDWSSLPVLLLIVAVASAVCEPAVNTYSRWQEHQADVYGLQVTRGIVSNSDAEHSFQVMGEIGLDEPDPNPFIVFWLYSHPSTSSRFDLARDYPAIQ
jgi:Zn-dependent protease with chaperone function